MISTSGAACGETVEVRVGGAAVSCAGDAVNEGPLGEDVDGVLRAVAVAGLQARCMVRAPESSVNAKIACESRTLLPQEAPQSQGVCTYTSATELVAGADMATQLELGARIRAIRQARQLTLRDVSERAGVTESFLSQVERDVTSPSIATLQRIARALDLSIAQLFAEEPETGRVVRREARRQVAYPGLKSIDEFLTSNMAGRLQVILSTIQPGGGTGAEPYTHDSDEEVVVVLERCPRPVGRRRALRPARGRCDHVPIPAAALEHEPGRCAGHGPVLPDPTEFLSPVPEARRRASRP